ncbi:MAG: hypothetical protein JJ953_12450 [Gracilimonas sp.]|uniref:FIMAH domain-containing protein n=1 Tax=Gracilimonas TaxID=649462 RepID=UPI001B0A9F34|nr:hypothetical protein [Gracilimonas sp.]MBO6586910.1 hypothetical protein [Gracilimonas sp.]MBO6614602.1 hypothetical protein [Gracilimonas sp.]
MKYLKFIVPILLVYTSQNVFGQQIINQLTFDTEKGYFRIIYQWESNDSLFTGTVMPGDNVSPRILADVKSLSTGQFEYSYTINNQMDALYPLYEFSILLDEPVNEILTPNNQWDGSYLSRYRETSWAKVGGDIPGISSGDTLNGFSYVSNGIPSIKNSYSKNYVWYSFPSEPQGPTGRLGEVVDSLLTLKSGVLKKTLGPWSPNPTMNLISFTDSLETFRYRSCEELGWITNQGICNSLQVKLRNFRRHLERDKPKQARNVLHAFINQVEAQRGKHITEEGYALLYFNAEYLMDKLDSGRGN